ncbi:MAG TPA: ABC transporter permease [Bryobacteraceae bacterium]|nr:ABC transporter permease [Bryobacteraceae bacterium]
MRPLRRFFNRLIFRITRQGGEEQLRVEIEEHLALQTAENLRAGLSPTEARREAALKFGGVEAMKERYRDQRGLPFLETLIRDVRLALRRLRMAPAFTAAATLTLALGIGATTSIFTLAHAVLLKSLPVAKPEELYRLGKKARCCYLAGYSQDKEFSLVSYDLYKHLRDNTKGFAELAAFPAADLAFGVGRGGRSEAAQTYAGEFVSGNYFAMFGIRAYAGRMLNMTDDRVDAAPVAVMSYRLWRERYGSDPSVVGSAFDVDKKPFTIVGIAPPGFFGDTLRGTPPDLFLPLNTEPYIESEADLNKYGQHWLELIGRMAPGAHPAAIEAEMRVKLKQWLRSHWGEMSAGDRAKFSEQTLYLVPGGAGISSMRERYERWLHILMAVTGFALLIVCANVASLMLVRGMERRRQTSLSMALGAAPSRIVRQDLTESILLSFFGGALGLAVAFVSSRLILHFAFPPISGMPGIPIDASPSLPVLFFAFGISTLAGIAFGIAPGWIATRTDPVEALRGQSRVTANTGSLPRTSLVVLQIAISLGLLSVSGLLTSALHALETQDFGFEQDRRVVAKFNPRVAGYGPPQLSLLYRRVHDAMANIPGVSSVALCLYSPPGGGWGSGVWVDGHAPGLKEDNSSQWDRVTPGYFEVIGTPILKGRGISEEDTATSRRVAVISETFARKFFRNEDPIGRHFGRTAETSTEFEVVGVARDARYYFGNNVDQPVVPMFFLPEAQADYTKSAGALFLHDIVISIKPGADVTAAEARHAMASVDPGMPIIWFQTLKEKVDLQFTQQRLIARLASFFGALSLILASVGLYGVIAYQASRRNREVGVRIALGATRGNVIGLVLKGAIILIMAGLSVGLPLTFAAGRLLGSQLYGLSPYNPLVIGLATGTLGLSALLASVIPAVRASLASPLDALRAE